MSEPESEDEEAIIRRRRELRQAIVQKYQVSQPLTEASSLATTPAPSEGSPDSDVVGDEATKALEELLIQEAEMKMKQRVGDEGGDSVGPAKTTVNPDEEEEREKKKSNLLAVKAAVRNTDMFSEGDIFGEKYLVRWFVALQREIKGEGGLVHVGAF